MAKRTRRAPPESAGPPATSRARAPAVREPAPIEATGLESLRDERVALAIATGRNLADAARAAGCGRRTVYDIVRKPEVIERVQAIRRELMAETMSRLVGLGGEAVEVMARLMRNEDGDTPHAVQLWAAQATLSNTLKIAEAVELRGELAELRRELAEIQGGRR